MTTGTVVRVEVTVTPSGIFNALTSDEMATINASATLDRYCEMVEQRMRSRYPGAQVLVDVDDYQRPGSLPVMVMFIDGTYEDGYDGAIDEAFWANEEIAGIWDAQQFWVEA